MSPVKRICVFEHSVMTNFNCTCPAIQRGQGSGFLSEGSSWLTASMSEQRRFWRDCADAISTKFAWRGPNVYDQRLDGNLTERVFDYFKAHRVDSHCLLLCWDRAWKIHIFLWLYKLTPVWFDDDFLGDIYDFYKQKMWNVAVDGMPLKWYKRYNTYGLSEKI